MKLKLIYPIASWLALFIIDASMNFIVLAILVANALFSITTVKKGDISTSTLNDDYYKPNK